MNDEPLAVLIVDDEPDHRELIRDVLVHAFPQVDVAEADTAAGALAELARRQYQAVILDYMLPDANALQVLPHLFASHPDVTVIVTTARGDEEVAAAAVRGGAADYLVKENLAARLPLSLQQGLEAAKLRRQARLAEEHIAHLNSVLRAIRNVDQLITRERDRDTLLQRACELLVAERGYDVAGVVLLDEQRRPVALFHAGLGEAEAELRARIESGQWPDYALGALAHPGELFVSPPHQRGPAPARFDTSAVFSMALVGNAHVYGFFGVALSPELSGDTDERALFAEMAEDLGFALRNLEIEAARARATDDLAQLNRLYQALVEIADIIVRTPDREQILREACRLAVERGGFAMSWIGFLEPDGKVRPVVHWGREEGYLSEIKINVQSPLYSHGPAARAIAEGRYIISDFTDSAEAPPWSREARRRGYRSVGAFPLPVGGRRGVFVLYSDQADLFSELRVQLLQTLAIDLAVALDALLVEQQRHEAEEALRQSEEQLRIIIEKAPVGITLRRGRKLLYVNPTLLRLLGYDRLEDIPGQDLLSLYAPEIHEMILQRIAARDVGEIAPQVYDIPCLTRDGRRVQTHIEVATISLRDGPASMGFHVDLSERVRMEEDLRREIGERKQAQELLLVQQADLRRLATQLGLVEERERRRVAGELHDYVVQLLAAAKLKLGLTKRADDLESYRSLLDDVEGIIQQALSRSRSLMYELTTSALYEIGFKEAVVALVHQYEERSGVAFTSHDDDQDKPLDKDVQVVLFQALRELLTNVTTHAHAAHAQVDMARDGSQFLLTVRDDGVGFDPVAAHAGDQPVSGFGLFSIRQRLRPFGGTMQVESAPGRGTKVVLQVPLQGATPQGPATPLQDTQDREADARERAETEVGSPV